MSYFDKKLFKSIQNYRFGYEWTLAVCTVRRNKKQNKKTHA